MKLSFPMLILAAAAASACNGCAAPVQPALKSPHSYQVPVDFENLGLLLKHGRQVLFPSSTPHCPYYDPKARLEAASGPVGPRDHGTPALPPVVHGESPEQVAPPSARPSGELPPAAAK
jgi:hypothetical protein